MAAGLQLNKPVFMAHGGVGQFLCNLNRIEARLHSGQLMPSFISFCLLLFLI
jgi:hypothetical protein